jgi:hypothetical protein
MEPGEYVSIEDLWIILQLKKQSNAHNLVSWPNVSSNAWQSEWAHQYLVTKAFQFEGLKVYFMSQV